jgi:hypothetical protein
MHGQPVNNEDKMENIDNVLMPPHMTSFLQPLENGVLLSPKAH